jgi:membrane peptidoglycan carboxypeptidase
MVPKQVPDQVLEAVKQAVAAVRPTLTQAKARALLYQRVVAAWVQQHQRAVAVSALAFALTLVVALAALFAGLPGRDELRTLGEMPQATTLYDVHNRPVFTIFKEYRIEVPLERISPHLRKAIVAFEDQRFEDHRGFDLIGPGRGLGRPSKAERRRAEAP